MPRRGADPRSPQTSRWPRVDLVVLMFAVLGAMPMVGGISPFFGPSPASQSDPLAASPQVGAVPGSAGPGAGSGPPGSSAGPVRSAGPGTSAGPIPSVGPDGNVTVGVDSIAALLRNLKDDTIDVIVVANGTYHVSPSSDARSDSLWIAGDAYANRTRPITVRAETPGQVVFDGGGATGFGGLSFEDGAHDQTWDGFVFANMRADESGIVEFGGYVPRRTPHHITMRNITVLRSCRGSATSEDAPAVDHAFYISNSIGEGPHDLLFEDISVDGRGGLASAVHFDHGDEANPNASRVTVRRLQVIGTQQAIILWKPALHSITFDQVTISGALKYAIRFESIGATNIAFSNITSTGSGDRGFYSSLGSRLPGVALVGTSLR